MAHLALYRKYRSQTFGDLMGQEHVVRTLQNSIKTGRIAHSYLLTGPRGTGKTSTARLLAKAVNCVNGPSAEPCNVCEHCVAISQGTCLDVYEMDAASESTVDDVRDKIVAATDYRPATCRYKVFIIDEVHDLSAKAFDALLKTIEEPPEHIIFVLATTEYTKVPATIRSRCQKFEFHRATMADLMGRLEYVCGQEGVEAEKSALLALARMADGGYRDALTLLEQAMLVSDGKVTLQSVYDQMGLIGDEQIDELMLAIKERRTSDLLNRLDEIYRTGRDPRSILESLLYRVSDLTRTLYGVEIGALHDAALEATLKSMSARIGEATLTNIRTVASCALKSVRDVTLPRLWLEAELIGLTVQPAPAPAEAPVRQPSPQAPKATPQPTAPPTAAPSAAVVAPRSEPSPPPASTAPAAEGDPELVREATAAWHSVRESIGEKSPTARQKLEKTYVLKVSEEEVKVGFARQLDLDWVRDKPKFLPVLEDIWRGACEPRAQKLTLVMDAASKPLTPMHENTAELPASGDKLLKMGIEVFKDDLDPRVQ